MFIYNYDNQTKEYLGKTIALVNPKREKEYLIPANATDIEPPEKKEGYALVFEKDVWNYVKDYRGEPVINTTTSEMFLVEDLGELDSSLMLLDEYHKTPEYKKLQEQIELNTKKQQIKNQIYEFDNKRIRAICEPENKTDNQTWLEYYTEQIQELRQQLKEL